ncbi:MAG TPA: sigma-70 family RNA polymerase sigma factor [Planctomycetes bacterium]|nr:sigma-70 family RNA polymerase sigma factor [Planctomycetota bacterium]
MALSDDNARSTLRVWERHSGFLRRLALGLVADAAAADDVLQEAWIATAQGEHPEGSRSQRAWLSGVVRNVARKLVRSDARRRVREHRAARAESLPSASDTAARVELLGRVVQAVHALDEPYRTVLLLRFLDELTPGEIAELQGVPVDTVHTRIRRGLGRLRTELSTSAGSDEGTWLAALLPFAKLPHWTPGAAASATAATTGSALPPALLMSTTSKCTLALGVLALASITTWQLVRPRATPAAPDSGSTADAAALPPADSVVHAPQATPLAPEARPETRVAAAPEAAAWVLRGRAMRGEDPFPGLEVVLHVWEGPELDAIDTERAPDRELRVTTDEHGAFSHSFEEVRECAVASAEPAEDPGEEIPFRWHTATVRTAAGEQPPAVELHLVPLDALLVGTVRNLEGDPIPGARVWQFEDPVTTDEHGRYRLRTRAREGTFLYATAEGYSIQRSVVEGVLSGRERTVNFELKAEFRVEGTVLDTEGRPVRGATVTSFYTPNNEALTDAMGRYSLGHLDPGRPEYTISARKSGFVMASTGLRKGGREVGHVDFTLDRGVRVEGHVVDANGSAVEGAEAYIGFSRFAYDRIDPEFFPGGAFAFPAVGRGMQTLVVEAEGYAPSRTVLAIPDHGDVLFGVEVVLDPAHFVAGRVLDESGDPIEGVRVFPLYFCEYMDTQATSDASGRFRLEGLPGSDLALEFYAPGKCYQRLEEAVAEVDVDDFEVSLVPAGGLAGRVLDGITGQPVKSFRVRFVAPGELAPGEVRLSSYSASWLREGHLFESDEGTWNTEDEDGLPPSTVVGIEIRAEGYAPTVEPHAVVSTEPEEHLLTLELFPGGTLEGTVLSAENHSPLEGATVKLYRSDEEFAEGYSDDTHNRRIARVDTAGRFRFENVASGEHRLLVLAENLRAEIDGPFEVAPGGTTQRLIELEAGSTLEGTLRDWQGNARAGVEVLLTPMVVEPSSPFRDWRTTTDEEGGFRFTGLPAGTFRIGPMDGSGGSRIVEYQNPLELRDGEELAVDLAPMGSATLIARIACDDDLPARLPVSATPIDPEDSAPYVLDSVQGFVRNGVLEIHGVRPGTYLVRVRYADYRSQTVWSSEHDVEVSLSDGEEAEVFLEVRSFPTAR